MFSADARARAVCRLSPVAPRVLARLALTPASCTHHWFFVKHPRRALNHFSALSHLLGDTGILTFPLDTPVGELPRPFLFLLACISSVGRPLQTTTELGLKTKVYSLMALKASSPQSVCGQGCAPHRLRGRIFCLPLAPDSPRLGAAWLQPCLCLPVTPSVYRLLFCLLKGHFALDLGLTQMIQDDVISGS